MGIRYQLAVRYPGRREYMYRCASEPAGGVGWRNPEIAAVWLTNGCTLAEGLRATKLGPRKCRIWALVGFCGVGASGSTAAITNGPLPTEPTTLNVGGPAVTVMEMR